MGADRFATLRELAREAEELKPNLKEKLKKAVFVVLGVDFTTRAVVKAYFKKYHPKEQESTVEDVCELVTGEDFVMGVAFTTTLLIGWGPVDSMLKILKIKTMFGVLSGIVP